MHNNLYLLLAKSLFWFLVCFFFHISFAKLICKIICKINCKAHAHKYAFLEVEVGIDVVGVAQNYVDVLDMLIVGHPVGGCGLNGCGLPGCGLSGRGLLGRGQPLGFDSVDFVAIAVVIVVVLIVVDFSAVELCIFDALISFSWIHNCCFWGSTDRCRKFC